ncbi:PilX N-terminal domain-containing pilus assembly protein [Paucibacter sp. R3-3]|uniref:PilX N-terminal domain-containing pilus assembly protein n=1 Tax=Roseateles agri TaxID=3098619 RepID=A0ABU5DHR1_9BURK|nr:PilX N-terminal domain-containing pilus assembly protein [Paucibacter sp. R3-3]MDY0745843.1 PilX N-terminal domain-containing pilus assembly protein [Paucibacter sp. R3-3]
MRPPFMSLPHRQRGAATLVVVMILFFIMAMMAAYANRGLIFEQRIASNYYRSGVAVEAADAGLEWTLAMLNGVNVGNDCKAATGVATNTFRQRYLGTDNQGLFKPVASSSYEKPFAACVRRAGRGLGWDCNCPTAAPWAPTVPAAVPTNQLQPSFQVGLYGGPTATPAASNLVWIVSVGCSGSNPSTCTVKSLPNLEAATQQQLASSYATVKAALVSALKSPPTTPLTVLQNVNDGGAGLGLHNADPAGSGLLLLAGGAATTLDDGRLESLPGTPGQKALITNDAALTAAGATPEGMFARFFGMTPAQYQQQPAIRDAGCASGCDATALAAVVATGAQMVWVDGDLSLSGNGSLGTASLPVVIVVNGNVTISGTTTINGVLYAKGDINVSTGSSQAIVNGAVIGGGNLTITGGRLDINYQSTIINAISNGVGSFVRVPGSWYEGEAKS